MQMKVQRNQEWSSRVFALWLTVGFLLLASIGYIYVGSLFFMKQFQWFNLWHYALSGGLLVIAYFLVLFAITYARLAVRLEIADGELRARGLFGQRWRIPLTDIEAFRDADIYRHGRKQPVLQVGVIAGGMRSFVEALQENAPNLKVVETEHLIKQGRW